MSSESIVPEQAAETCAELLARHFPALFTGGPKPLKLRIQADIRERVPGVFSKQALSAFLRQHTGRNAYLIALTRAAHRFDLDGQPSGEVSAEHRQAALDELARRRKLRESRIAQEHEQQRQRADLLRAFDATTLTRANFCALKGIAPEHLDVLLQRAREEAALRPRQGAEQAPRRRHGRHEGR